jgi:hypothetical protein
MVTFDDLKFKVEDDLDEIHEDLLESGLDNDNKRKCWQPKEKGSDPITERPLS